MSTPSKSASARKAKAAPPCSPTSVAEWLRSKAAILDDLPELPPDPGGRQDPLIRALSQLPRDPSPLPLEPSDLPLLL